MGARLLAAVRQSVEAGELKMTSFWTAVCVHAVYSAAVADFGDPGHPLAQRERARGLHGPALRPS